MEAKQVKRSKGAGKAPRKSYRPHSVKTKCEAVLSIWSERRKPAELCRELGVSWAVLSQWQNKALEGMMSALDPKTGRAEPQPALNPLLQQRLQRKITGREAKRSKLERRLTGLLESRPPKEEGKE